MAGDPATMGDKSLDSRLVELAKKAVTMEAACFESEIPKKNTFPDAELV